MTNHQVIIGSAQRISQLQNASVHLVVTSPPYPMIEMWDETMAKQNPLIKELLDNGNPGEAFELMHKELDNVWREVERVLMPGGFVCINIGDATRTFNEQFSLYPNHARIIATFLNLGFSNLPNILWRKQTNAPNKFMGSGMLPAGAYVTLEHEWILIFRKGAKRNFDTADEKRLRRESSFFWEERNVWCSDVWDLKGAKQKMTTPEIRKRSAAYPLEIPYRLINMYSLKGDTVLDPFLGTGTTSIASILSERNSIGVEIDGNFKDVIMQNISSVPADQLNQLITSRIDHHRKFIHTREDVKHFNEYLSLPVMTSQETEIKFSYIEEINKVSDSSIVATYSSLNNKAGLFVNDTVFLLD